MFQVSQAGRVVGPYRGAMPTGGLRPLNPQPWIVCRVYRGSLLFSQKRSKKAPQRGPKTFGFNYIGPDKGPSSEAQEWILQWIPPAGMDSFYLITGP